jgi:nucleoside-diphosphate-sugar epimerase
LLVAAGHRVTAVARSEQKAAELRTSGAESIDVDLFDPGAVGAAVEGQDAIGHLATNIPTGASAGLKRGWATNDRLRAEAAANLSTAAIAAGVGRYVQESITFPYVDGGDSWLDETAARTYFWGNRTTLDAEAAAAAVTAAGGTGVALRFAMFMAPDSTHMLTFASMARKGGWGLFGDDDAFVSFIGIDNAAAAVLAALELPAGLYNVAEPDPRTRGEHRAALASAVGRTRLRSLPGVVQKVGGDGAASLARSHRISSEMLRAASSWAPTQYAVESWSAFA